jgi:hypothetical protein
MGTNGSTTALDLSSVAVLPVGRRRATPPPTGHETRATVFNETIETLSYYINYYSIVLFMHHNTTNVPGPRRGLRYCLYRTRVPNSTTTCIISHVTLYIITVYICIYIGIVRPGTLHFIIIVISTASFCIIINAEIARD